MPEEPKCEPAPAPEQAQQDVVLLHSRTDDGEGVRVIRARTGRPLETGEVRPIKEGKPLMGGEIVTLKPREGAPQVCDVEVTYKPAPKAEARKLGPGPAQVATDEYRASYDRTFTSRSN